MYPAILGKKIGMTQVYDEDGVLHPVTVVEAGPCTVLQVKTSETDGYNAIQLGYEEVRPHRATKSAIGHAAKVNTTPKKYVSEVRLEELPEECEPGSELTVALFEEVASVDVRGTGKGKGFAGVMRRYNFGGLKATHGTKRKDRHPGSIAGHGTNLGTGGKIKKGKRMAGRMGGKNVTSRDLRLIRVDVENNLLLIKGAVPGPKGGYVDICKSLSCG